MSNCCNPDCREFIGVAGVAPDGIYQRIQDDGIKWFGPQGNLVVDPAVYAALNTNYAAAPRKHCSLYTQQATEQDRHYLMEEVNTTTKQPTGVLVEATRPAGGGATTYTNIGTGAAYDPAADPLTELTDNEDADFVLDSEQGCDQGVNIQRRQWLPVGSDTPIAAATVVDLVTGAAHTLSGNETWGAYCVAGTRFTDPVIRCAKVRDANGDVAAGTVSELVYEVVEVTSATGAPVAMTLTKVSDNSAVVEGAAATEYLVDRGCC